MVKKNMTSYSFTVSLVLQTQSWTQSKFVLISCRFEDRGRTIEQFLELDSLPEKEAVFLAVTVTKNQVAHYGLSCDDFIEITVGSSDFQYCMKSLFFLSFLLSMIVSPLMFTLLFNHCQDKHLREHCVDTQVDPWEPVQHSMFYPVFGSCDQLVFDRPSQQIDV
jgi:hypothetical protein